MADGAFFLLGVRQFGGDGFGGGAGDRVDVAHVVLPVLALAELEPTDLHGRSIPKKRQEKNVSSIIALVRWN